MGKYVTVLEKIFKQLEKESPWTKAEKRDLSNRDKVFVRNLQIKDKITKKEAVKKYKEQVIKGPEHYKKLQKDTTSYIKELYPVHDMKPPEHINEPKRSGVKSVKIKPQEFAKVLEKTVNPKKRLALKNAHKKYPDASLYELRQGVTSIKSAQYRLRHGQDPNYTGRIISLKKK